VVKELIVDVVSRSDNEFVIRTDKGEEKKFTREPGWAYFEAHSLTITKSTSWISLGAANVELPGVNTRIRGTASMEKGSFSIIGEPANRSKKLALLIGAVNPVEPQRNGITGWVGFNRRDWEIGNDDEWWVQCDLPIDAFESLLLAISDGSASKLSIGILLKNGFTDFAYAPPSEGTNWFLVPDDDNSIDNPRVALGEVSSFHLECSSVALNQEKIIPEEEMQLAEESALTRTTVEPTYGVQLKQLEVAIMQLRSSLKWIGWFVVIALALIASK